MSTDISREAAEDAAEAFRRWRSEQHRWDKDSEAEDCLRRLILSAIDRATAALREENARLLAGLESLREAVTKADRLYTEWEAIRNQRDELRAECERLRQQLNSANQQHQLKAI